MGKKFIHQQKKSTDNASMKKYFAKILMVFMFCSATFAQSQVAEREVNSALLVTQNDLKLVPDGKSFETITGYHLYIKKKPTIESVLLTETTKDPEGKEDNFAFRASEWNEVNGDEMRLLDGKPLVSKYAQFSLVDSSTENLAGFGECFHIYIPSTLIYGYPWERNGTVKIGRGTFINIRTFSKKYADYTGDYFDNPFMFDLGKTPVERKTPPEPPVELTDNYNPVAAAKFKELDNSVVYSKGPKTLVEDIQKKLRLIPNEEILDVVFTIDATGSMLDDIAVIRKDLVPALKSEVKRFKSVRIGLLLYRDYVDSWNYKNLPVKFFDFTNDLDKFQENLMSFRIIGGEGGDIPEAVYEALFASLSFYKWNPAAVRKIILIGDAEPHPRPKGTGEYTKELVEKLIERKNVEVNTIILPNK